MKFKKNKIYYSDYNRGWLFRFHSLENGSRIMYYTCMEVGQAYFNTANGELGWGNKDTGNIREATPEEAYWLEQCEKAGSWVPKPETPVYEIF